MAKKIYRILFITFSYCIMWRFPDSPNTLFVSLCIFTAGLVYDYWSLAAIGFEEDMIYQKTLGVFGIFLSVVFLLFSILGLANFFELKFENSDILVINGKSIMVHFNFNLNIILKVMLLFPFLAGLEIFGGHKRDKKEGNLLQKGGINKNREPLIKKIGEEM